MPSPGISGEDVVDHRLDRRLGVVAQQEFQDADVDRRETGRLSQEPDPLRGPIELCTLHGCALVAQHLPHMTHLARGDFLVRLDVRPGQPFEQILAPVGRAVVAVGRPFGQARRFRVAVMKPFCCVGDPAPAAADDGTRADKLLWRLRQVYDWDGRLAESEKQARIEAGTQASLERWQVLREEWNRQVDRAEKQGVHVIYTGEYHTLRSELKTAARDDPYMPEEVRSEIDSLIHELGAAERARDRVVERGAALADRLARRCEVPDSEWSRDERAFVDRKAYDPWRRDTEKAVEAAERVLADRMRYGVHLQGLTLLGLQSAVTGARKVLTDDDRQMAEALVPERKGDDPRRREERIAGLLDDPENLRELHRRQIERKEARKAARRRRKGRYQVRSMRM